MRLDFFRLIALGLGLTCPILISNALVAAIIVKDLQNAKDLQESSPEDKEHELWGIAGMISIVMISLISLIGFTYKFSLYRALWVLFWFELIVIIFSLSTRRRRANR